MQNRQDPIVIRNTIGSNLRYLRKVRGYSQATIGAVLGVSFQQIQKYERGRSRLSAGDIYQLADFMGIPITDFFSNLPEYKEMMPDIELMEIHRQLKKVTSSKVRRKIIDLAGLFIEENSANISPQL